MKYSVTWIVNFSNQDITSVVLNLFDKSWCKYNHFKDLP